jgi:hypothetical protein
MIKIWNFIRKKLGILSSKEKLLEQTKKEMLSQQSHFMGMMIDSFVTDQYMAKHGLNQSGPILGQTGLIHPLNPTIPDSVLKKEKLRPRSIFDDWEVTQDSG